MKSPLLAAAPVAAVVLSLAASPALAEERSAAPHAPPAHRTENEKYFFVQAGLFDPSGGDGPYMGGGMGFRANDLVAFEVGVSTYRTEDHGADVTVVPFTAGVRLIRANPVVEPYAGLGGGYYNTEEQGLDGYFWGWQASLGIDGWVTPKVALNAEFRYHLLGHYVSGRDVDADGPSFSVGMRVGY